MKLFARQLSNMPTEIKGVLCALIACAFFSGANCVIRKTSSFIDPIALVSYRSFCCILFALPLLMLVPRRERSFSVMNRVNFYKAAVDLLSIPLWASAIKYMQMTEVVALSFMTPIFSAFLAILFLKDKPTIERWASIFLSLIGVYIILVPEVEGFNYYSICVLLSCLLWSMGSIFVKNLTYKQHPILIVLYSNILIFFASITFNYGRIKWLSLDQAFCVASLAALVTAGNLALAYAYKHTRVTVVLPFDYTRLVFTTFYAYIFFGEVIRLNTLIGSLVIFFSVFVVANHAAYLKLKDLCSLAKVSIQNYTRQCK